MPYISIRSDKDEVSDLVRLKGVGAGAFMLDMSTIKETARSLKDDSHA